MMQLIKLIKGLIMKASRFILNTDYITPQNDQEVELMVTLPASFSVSAGQVKHYTANKTITGSASKDFRCYFTSTAQAKATTGCTQCFMKYGNDALIVAVKRSKDKFTLDVFNLAEVSSHTFSGSARTVTAHIQTFVDPFQV